MATKMTREEALNKVRQMSLPKETMEILEALAPELKESEDERIRKHIIAYLRNELHNIKQLTPTTTEMERWLAYLEKQKDQKPAEVDESTKRLNDNWMKQHFDEYTEQKPAEWSEEDEEMLNSCISSIEESKENRYAYKETDGDTSYDREVDWLKSLRPQPKKGYSDEDEDRISDVLWCIEQSRKVAKNENDMGTCWSAERFVKSLRPQQRQEWSDEEKEILDSILSHYVLIDKPIDANGISKEKYISLIKSIRFDTYKNCNSHWKPSEEHLSALLAVFNDPNNIGSQTCQLALTDLYEQLKKL